MKRELKSAFSRVLKEAAEHERFFDLSDAERLAWMIERAFLLGMQSVDGSPIRQSLDCAGAVHERNASARTVRGQGRRKF